MHYAVVLHLAVSFCACADILNVEAGHLAEKWRRGRKEKLSENIVMRSLQWIILLWLELNTVTPKSFVHMHHAYKVIKYAHV